MRKMLPLMVLASILSVSMARAADYGWHISASSTDPLVNTSIPQSGLGTIYLWLSCTTIDGLASVEFDLQSAGFIITGFTPMNGALNAGDNTHLLLAVGGCPRENFLIGNWGFFDPSGLGGNACLVNSAANGWNVSVDCDTVNPTTHPNAVGGFASDGSTQCATDLCTVAVESETWGGIKTMYR